MGDYADLFGAAVAAELRAERSKKQITIAAVVDATGLSKSAVLNYLNGKRDIPVPAYMDLCLALRVDTRVIFDRAEASLKSENLG